MPGIEVADETVPRISDERGTLPRRYTSGAASSGMRDAAHLADEDRMRLGLELLRQHAVECGDRIRQHRRAGCAARPLPEGKSVVAVDALLAAEGERERACSSCKKLIAKAPSSRIRACALALRLTQTIRDGGLSDSEQADVTVSPVRLPCSAPTVTSATAPAHWRIAF